MKIITAYTDGSAITKGEKLGGIGSYIKYGDKEIYLSKGYKNTTISRMEMRAILITIQKIPIDLECELTIYSDSQFICRSFNEKWIRNWERDSFIGRKNSDLWKLLLQEIRVRENMEFKIRHLRGHQKDLGNEHVYGNNVADTLCSYKNFKEFEKDL